jgi:hypothetical protein
VFVAAVLHQKMNSSTSQRGATAPSPGVRGPLQLSFYGMVGACPVYTFIVAVFYRNSQSLQQPLRLMVFRCFLIACDCRVQADHFEPILDRLVPQLFIDAIYRPLHHDNGVVTATRLVFFRLSSAVSAGTGAIGCASSALIFMASAKTGSALSPSVLMTTP